MTARSSLRPRTSARIDSRRGADSRPVPSLGEGHARYELSAIASRSVRRRSRGASRSPLTEGREYVLIAGAGRSGVEAALGALRRPIVTLIPLLLALAVTGGWWLARRALAP